MKVEILGKVGIGDVTYVAGDKADISNEDYEAIVELDKQAGRDVRVKKVRRVKKDAD